MTTRWGDQHDATGRGRFRDTLARVFGDADNPLNWAVTLGNVAGIRVRIHIFFIIFIAARLLFSIAQDAWGFYYAAIAMALLFALVLLHEFGHCFACRAVGGEADDILMWPLGGLASCAPPNSWRAHLVTTLGGPAVNAALAPVFAGALILAGMREHVVFNPFQPRFVLSALDGYWKVALWLGHYMNLVLLGFNLLLPVFPLDGGRVLRDLLWWKQGRQSATEIAVTTGLFLSMALALFGLVGGHPTLVGVGAFCGVTCWFERRRLRAPDDLGRVSETGLWGGSAEHGGDDEEEPRPPSRRELRRREREADERAEVDRILAKIAASGMDSLSGREKSALHRATKKRRRG